MEMESLKTNKDTIAIISFLTESSCCSGCIVRLLGIQHFENESAYKEPKKFINQLIVGDNQTDEDNTVESINKKLKRNICPVCLDCFEKRTIEKFVDCFGSLGIGDYKYTNFFFNISFPKCLAIRAHGMLLHLKKQFPEFPFGNLYERTLGRPDEVLLEQPHKIFRAVASDILAKALDKKCHPKSNLSLLITIGYENDNLEVANMKNIIKNKSSRKQIVVSRNNIPEFLKDIDDRLFRANFSVPPEVPDKEVLLDKVTISADPIYLGGRYLKFKRNVGQTPWIVDGVSVSEHNVQDIISDAIFNVLRCKKSDMTFTGSGREDVDVRMLGTGRPFYIKIDNPKEREFSPEQLLEVERQIIKSELAAVIKLQSVYASDLTRIKSGEEKKKKTYKALCKTTAPNIKEAISAINNIPNNLNVSQMTVMRVLHRRTLMPRDKVIHKMCAVEVPGHDDLFELELVTQAGTYVKEFIHGDFERTQPNITSILGYETDLVALDCMDIALHWPEDDPSLVPKKSDTK